MNTKAVENCFIELKCHRKIIVIGSLYRPPNQPEKEFLEYMNQCLQNLNRFEKNKEIIIGMDHNLDLLKHNIQSLTQKFMESLLDNNYLPTITRPTRITNSTATLLANIILSMDLYDKHVGSVVISNISNPLPCFVIIRDCLHVENTLHVKKHKLIEKNISMLRLNLNGINWVNLLRSSSTNKSINKFHS